MIKEMKRFKKLPGRPFFLFSFKRLWQGPDHLLWVETILGQEHYRRFYYKDIQSIVLLRTRHHHCWSAVWGALSLLLGIIAQAVSAPLYITGFLIVFFLAALAVNFVLGPSCTVYLQTAVQLQRISLGRLRKARHAIDRLREIIENEQGALDVLPAVPAQSYPGRGDLHADRSDPGSTVPPFPLLHYLLFSVLIAAGVCRLFQFGIGWIALGFLDLLLIAAGLTIAAAALVRGYRQIKNRRLVQITWTALIFCILHGLTDYFYLFMLNFQNSDLVANQWGLLKRLVEALMGDHPATIGIQVGSAAISLILGCTGFLSLRKK